ncbi:MAG: response regulator transcription factor [Desulfonatronovibrio sp.]
MESAKKVLIITGPQMFREFLSAMLDQRSDLEVVEQVFDGIHAVDAVKKYSPDLLILDYILPRLNGISVLNAVRDVYPEMKTIVLTDYKSEQSLPAIFEAGANGYCIKDTSRDEMLLAIASVMAGQTFICTGIADEVVDGYLEGRKKFRNGNDREVLTPREQEVLKLLAEAYKNREIGDMLHISAKTVEKHRSNIMNKLGLRNVAALTVFAMEHGLVNGAGNPFVLQDDSTTGFPDEPLKGDQAAPPAN